MKLIYETLISIIIMIYLYVVQMFEICLATLDLYISLQIIFILRNKIPLDNFISTLDIIKITIAQSSLDETVTCLY